MASNGLLKRAKKGTCRMCLRVRDTDKQVTPVGEVSHGFATGYVWECIDSEECDKAIAKKMSTPGNIVIHERLKIAMKIGRFIRR